MTGCPRSRGLIALLLGLAVAAAVSSCAPPADALTVPTDADIGSVNGDMGALQGRLEGERSTGGGACFWVDGPNGRAFLVLREGSYATPDLRLHLSGAQLSTLAVGTTYLFAGAPGSDRAPRGCEGDGVEWITGQVSPEDPNYSTATLPPPKRRA